MLSASVRRGVSVVSFAVGLQLGSLASVLVLGVVGVLLRDGPLAVDLRWRWWALGLIAVVLLLRAVGALRFRLPQNARLVPETVFRFGPVWGPLQFGIEMGSGVRTYVTSVAPYLLLAAGLLVASWPQLLLAGCGFALGRAVMTAASVASVDPTRWHRRFLAARALPPALIVLLVALLATGAPV